MPGPARLVVDIVTDARGAARGVDQADREFGRLEGSARKFGAAAAAGLAGVAVAVAGIGVEAVQSASRLQQSAGAIETVFGAGSAQIEQFAKDAANSLGLAQSEYQELASLVGSQLQNMGVSQADSVKQSDELIRVGADMAATYGGSVADAVGAVSSLLKGEADPIERYGVGIKAADVSARLAAQGLSGLTGEALKQAQTQATLALLTEQTAKTQGAFGRESNTLAGQQERLGAQLENVKARLGEQLLPVLTAVAEYATGTFIPWVTNLGGELSERFGPAVSAAGAFVSDVLWPALQNVAGFIGAEVIPILRDYFQPILEGIQSAFGKVAGAVDGNSGSLEKLKPLLDTVMSVAETLAPIIGETLGVAFETVGTIIGLAADAIGAFIDVAEKAIDIAGKVAGAVEGAAGIASDVGGFLNPFGAAPLALGRPSALVGPSARLASPLRRLATFAAGAPALPGIGGTSAGGQVVVDRSDRRVFVRVDGALDPVAVARQLQELLAGQGVRLGVSGPQL